MVVFTIVQGLIERKKKTWKESTEKSYPKKKSKRDYRRGRRLLRVVATARSTSLKIGENKK
jgi:hypothetical protein